jgi:hypothetical protein
MQFEYNPSLSDPPIDHAAWTDPRVLDRSKPEWIFSPYPELWGYWQGEMDSPTVYDQYCSGGIHRMHNPRYLRDVVRQHLIITEHMDPPVLPVFTERIVTILAGAPDFAERRQDFLTDPWQRALRRHYVRLYNLPDFVEKEVECWNKNKDPYSKASLLRNKVLNAIFSGEIEVREIGSDEVIAHSAPPANRASRGTASSN